MRRLVKFLSPLVAAGMVGGWTTAAWAEGSPAQSPVPVAGKPSCNGLIIAGFNHLSESRSGNTTASSGPGPFFGPDTHEAIEELARRPNC